jgi:hypothetical protein
MHILWVNFGSHPRINILLQQIYLFSFSLPCQNNRWWSATPGIIWICSGFGKSSYHSKFESLPKFWPLHHLWTSTRSGAWKVQWKKRSYASWNMFVVVDQVETSSTLTWFSTLTSIACHHVPPIISDAVLSKSFKATFLLHSHICLCPPLISVSSINSDLYCQILYY